jgi:ferric-dicitrate binding protein FerR (iron transport regulator)
MMGMMTMTTTIPVTMRRTTMTDPLELYRTAMERREEAVAPAGKNRVWDALSAQLTVAAPTPIYSLGWFRAAAAVFVTASLGLSLWFTVPRTAVLATTDDAMAVVTLDDGSTIRLRPDSELRSTSRGFRTRYQLTGEAWFDIAPQSGGEFVVETASATVTVLGTRFVFGERDRGARVVLAEGRVRFSATADPGSAVILAPGQTSDIGPDGRPTDPAPADLSSETAWTSGLLQLDAMPLSEIVTALSAHFGVELTLPAGWESERIGGSLSLDNLDQSLDELNRLLPEGIEVRRR